MTAEVEPLDCGYRVVGILLLLLAISEIIADLNMVFWHYPGQTFKFHAKKHPFSCVFWKFVIIKSTIIKNNHRNKKTHIFFAFLFF